MCFFSVLSPLMNILIIDDDLEDCDLFREALSEVDPDCTCTQAHDGQEGLKILLQETTALPDFVFLDINMPVMNGMECLVQIKNHSRLKNIPVIMYSTTSNTREIKSFYNLGAHDFLIKPHDYRKLVEALQSIITSNSTQKVRM